LIEPNLVERLVFAGEADLVDVFLGVYRKVSALKRLSYQRLTSLQHIQKRPRKQQVD
jgi:hypothetical protein